MFRTEGWSMAFRLTDTGREKLKKALKNNHAGLVGLTLYKNVANKTGLDYRIVQKAYEGTGGIYDSTISALNQTYALGLDGADYEPYAAAPTPPTEEAVAPAPPKTFAHLPYARNPFFTGRDEDLKAIADALNSHQTAAITQAQAITGSGGVGKSSLAAEYAYRNRDRYQTMLWLRAESDESLSREVANLTYRLFPELPADTPQEQRIQKVVAWLRGHEDGKWLLILDNADTPKLARDFLRNYFLLDHKGHLLITSRNEHIRETFHIAPLPLNTLPPDKATDFLWARTKKDRAKAPPTEREAAERLAKTLYYYPLALEQAGAYIDHVAGGRTFTKYLAEYQDRDKRLSLMGYGDDLTHYEKTVLNTWQPNFDALKAEHPFAADLLGFCGYLAPDSIPYELLEAYTELYGEGADCGTAIGEITAYSLLMTNAADTESEALPTYRIHGMVRDILKQRDNDEEEVRRKTQVVESLVKAYPNWAAENYFAWEAGCRRLQTQWRACLDWIGSVPASSAGGVLYNQMAYFYKVQGRYGEAEPLYLEGLAIRRKSLPEGHPSIATSLNNLAGLYRSQGRYGEAEPLQLEDLAISRKSLPEGHPDIAGSLNNLAYLYQVQGRYVEAEPLFLQALAIRRKSLPEGHPQIAGSLNNLAGLYRSQGRYVEAEPLYLEAAQMVRKSLGKQHPNTQIVLNNYLSFLREQGKEAAAEAFRRQWDEG